MNIFNKVRQDIIEKLHELRHEGELPHEVCFDAVTAEPPREASHGDIATNAAMVLAKPAQKNPRKLAEDIVKKLHTLTYISEVSIAGPGFINIRLDQEIWQQAILDVLANGTSYGDSAIGIGENINIEYVSANPTGPMHIGHSRGAVFGDALATLMQKAGYHVTKEYYINDAGTQVEVLARSAFLRYREALGESIGEIPKGLYPGEYLKGVGQSLKDTYGDSLLYMAEAEWIALVRDYAVSAMMLFIREDLEALGIRHDVFSSEMALHNAHKQEEVLKLLDTKGLLYRGILEPPKGKTPEDWEPREQTLFRATDFGDDVDRALQKSDGSWTYFASDIAYHLDKYQRGFKKMTLILGADHGGYVKRMKAAVAAVSDKQAEIEVKLCQMVNFLQNGQPAKMSKRAGTFITARDVIDAVGKDIVRFIMLTRRNDMVLDFDLEKVKEQSKDNPVFYVQYAHARIHSVLRNASETFAEPSITLLQHIDIKPLDQLQDPAEITLIKVLALWPRIVESAALAQEPHRVAFYLQELAGAFHALWNRGKEDTSLRFIIPDNRELTLARLALIRAVSLVIASGLGVLGVEPVEEMH